MYFLTIQSKAQTKKICFCASGRVRCFPKDVARLCDLICLFTLQFGYQEYFTLLKPNPLTNSSNFTVFLSIYFV